MPNTTNLVSNMQIERHNFHAVRGNSQTADDVVSKIKNNLKEDGGFFSEHVSLSELKDINQIVEVTPKEILNKAISKLSDNDLKSWVNEIYDTKTLGFIGTGGLSASERNQLYSNLAEKLDAVQKVRIYNALEQQNRQVEFASSINTTKTKSGYQSVASDFASALANKTENKAGYINNLDNLLKSGFSDKDVNAYNLNNAHRDKIKEIEVIHKYKSSDCVTTMRDVMRVYFGDPAIGSGLNDLRYSTLLPQLQGKGYATKVNDFTFNDSKWTEIKDATRLTESVGKKIEELGEGTYLVSIAKGVHTMTLTYNGKEFMLHDQGTGWDKSFSSAKDLDAHLVKTTQDMRDIPTVQDNYSAILQVYRLN